MSISKKSMRSASELKAMVATPAANGRNVNLPSLPSNVEPDFSSAEFNSIGYYGDLLSRLDSQIVQVESVYKQSFNRVTQQKL